jgi:hypothetical protein
VSRIFHQVLYAIGELRDDMIKPPSTATHPKIMGSHRWFPFLKVLSCLYVSHTCSYQCVSTYVNLLAYGHFCRIALVPLMAHMCWQGCLDTCNKPSGVGSPPQLRMFTYVLAGWEGSTHDALILGDAIERNDGFTVPAGNCTS